MQQFVAWAHADIAYKIKTKNTEKTKEWAKKNCLSALSQQGKEGEMAIEICHSRRKWKTAAKSEV